MSLNTPLPIASHLDTPITLGHTRRGSYPTLTLTAKVQQYDGPPSKRTRSQYNSNCKACTDHTAPHQTPFTPPTQNLPLSAPANYPTLSCNLQSNAPKQKRRTPPAQHLLGMPRSLHSTIRPSICGTCDLELQDKQSSLF